MPIWSTRTTAIESLGARFSTAALVSAEARLHAVDNAAVTSEDALSLRAFARRGHLARPVVTVVLDGRARVSLDGAHHWLAPGDALAMPQKAAVVMRQEGARYASLVCECDAARHAAPPDRARPLRLAARDLDAAHAAFDAVRERRRDDGALDAWGEVLGAQGLPVGRLAGAFDDADDPQLQRLSDALDRLLSDLASERLKGSVESQMGLSVRHFQRVVVEFHQRFGFNAEGWIDARNRRRLLLGAGFMTAPGAGAEAVGRAMGFASASAFSKALVNAGLPRPGAVAAAVAALREGDPEA